MRKDVVKLASSKGRWNFRYLLIFIFLIGLVFVGAVGTGEPDSTYEISNISLDADLEDIVCEGGGKFCHLAINDTDLIRYYPFDVNASATVAYDWTGNYDGIIQNVYWNATGRYGGAYSGWAGEESDTSIKIGSGTDFGNLYNGTTFVAWVYPDSAAVSNQNIIGKLDYNPNNRFFQFYRSSTKSIIFAIYYGGDNITYLCAENIATGVDKINQWQFVAGVYNKTDIIAYWGNTSGYITDSGYTSCDYDSINATAWLTESEDTFIGAIDDDGGGTSRDDEWNGTIDEVMIFNRSLTDNEIKKIFNATFPRFKSLGNHILNQTITAGDNRVNITLNHSNQNNTNISLKIYDGTTWSGYFNMSNGISQNFTISTSATNLNLSFLYIPDIYKFWSPILLENITLETWTLATNQAPTTPTPEINSTDGTNTTSQDLNCFDTLLDDDNDTMNVTVRWYKDNILNLIVDYNNSYSNGTLFNAVLGSGNTSLGDGWNCSMRLYDGQSYSSWGSSNMLIIDTSAQNGAPTPPPPNVTSTPNIKKHQWASMTPGTAYKAVISSKEVSLTQLTITTKNLVNDVEITVTKKSTKPATVTVNVTGTVYQYVDITTQNIADADIDSAKIRFNITQSWVDDNNLSADTVALNRYRNDTWQELTTTRIGDNGTYIEYEAETPGFSVFAITAATALEEAVCGNGIREGTEQCDGTDLAGETCISLDYASGNLSCNDNCTFNTSLCVSAIGSVCGNAVCETDENITTCPEDCPSQTIPSEYWTYIAGIIIIIIIIIGGYWLFVSKKASSTFPRARKKKRR